jgi:diaminohydroxyphosphoribosylaminopyrimidine deaminase/5-amino-6-(5-phosphoribosylamino)uracil reductase
LRLPAACKLVRGADRVPLIVIGGPTAADPGYPPGVTVKRVALGDTGVDLSAALGALHADGITRLLVEGGPTVARSFLDSGLVDEALVFRGHAPVGAGLKPLVDRGLEEFADPGRWRLAEERGVGPDRLSVYHAVGRM